MQQISNDISNAMNGMYGSGQIATPMNMNEATTQQLISPMMGGSFGMDSNEPSTSEGLLDDYRNIEKKKLKIKLKDDEILSIVQNDKQIASDYYDSELRDIFEDWEEQFKGIPEYYNGGRFRMPKSCFVSKDIMTTLRATMPDIMKLLLVKDPVEITGRMQEDVPKAKKMQMLCNWQITRLNNLHKILSTAFNEALLKGISVCKVTWIKEFETKVIKEMLHEDEIYELENQGIKIKNSEYYGEDEFGQIYYCEYEADVISKNQPKLDILPSVEFLFDPTAKDLQDAKFIIHRQLVTKDFLKRKELEGVYKDVDKINFSTSMTTYTDDEDDLYRVESGFRPDDNTYRHEARHSVVLNEYWGKLDVNDDGLLEDVVITFCGDVILSIEENTYGMYPFFAFSPYPSAFEVVGMGFADMIESIQTSKTALFREVLDNTRRNNDRKIFYRENAFLAPSQMNDPTTKYVAIDRNTPMTDVVSPEPFEQLPPNTLQIIEYLDKVRQTVTGISELKQGVSQKNITATEANIKYEATNSQVQLMAVNFSYTLKDIYEFCVYANQKFIDDKTVIRLLNETIEIDPEDLEGIFDLNITCALGGGSAESRRVALNNVLLTLIQIAEPRGITDIARIRNIIARIIEESGMKDIDSFVKTEQEIEQMIQEQQAQQAQQAQLMQAQQQIQMEGAGAKLQQEQNKALEGMEDLGVMQPQSNGQLAGQFDGMIQSDIRGL